MKALISLCLAAVLWHAMGLDRIAMAVPAVDLCTPKLKVSLWGPAEWLTLSLGKTDVWDRRRAAWETPVTLAEIRQGAFAPRIPCVTLAARMGDPTFVKRFRRAERPGVYCRVITPGAVNAGDPVTLLPFTGESDTIVENFRQFYIKSVT